jgi:hypothetical protein
VSKYKFAMTAKICTKRPAGVLQTRLNFYRIHQLIFSSFVDVFRTEIKRKLISIKKARGRHGITFTK